MNPEPERAKKQSADLVSQKLEELKAIFPEAVKDGAVDFAAIRSVIGDIPENKKGEEFFGLSWAGRSDAERAVVEPSRMTLVPKPEESVRWDEAKNLIIEGDNLEVLKLLLARYAGQVKIIYIDPPYNTGKDFVYRDDFQKSKNAYLTQTGQKNKNGGTFSTNPETSGRYHSDWLSMIYPRLKLARELLKDDGVIFASIDDNEAHHLKMVLEEIFGEENFIAQMVWEGAFKNDAHHIGTNHEYVFVFARDKEKLPAEWSLEKKAVEPVLKQAEQLKQFYGKDYESASEALATWFQNNKAKDFFIHRRFKYIDERGAYKEDDPTAPGGRKFDLVNPLTKKVIPLRSGRGWGFDQEAFEKLVSEGRVSFVTEQSVMVRRYLHETDRVTPQSVFYQPARSASERLTNLMGKEVFPFPKDEKILQDFIEMASGKDDLILDFFAGSGTTAHAVIDRNFIDGGSRRFILVQLPEPVAPESEAGKAGYKSVADITKDRVRRVIAGYRREQQREAPGMGFRVFSLASSAFPENTFEPDSDASEEENESALREHLERAAQRQLLGERSPESVAYEVALKEGLSPISKASEVSIGGQGMLHIEDLELGRSVLVWLAPKISSAEARAVAKELAPDGDRSDTVLVAFDSALDDSAKANLVANLRLKVL
jgi:adenine-specific DNA-methyltransferase